MPICGGKELKIVQSGPGGENSIALGLGKAAGLSKPQDCAAKV